MNVCLIPNSNYMFIVRVIGVFEVNVIKYFSHDGNLLIKFICLFIEYEFN